MVIATHDGSFHADEVFAVAALRLRFGAVQVVRTRDPGELADADLRVDVGFRHDPSSGDYDHHQRGFELARENGVRLASFGLVWREHGPDICSGDPEVARAVDESLVQSVDAGDVGQPLTRPLLDGVRVMTVAGVIGGFNARWDEDLPAEAEQARFEDAVQLAEGVLAREIEAAAAGRRAQRIVREALLAATDPRVVELPVNAPWKGVLVPEAPGALLVIYPKRQGFGVETVPRELGSFENRRDLPEAWAGLQGEELANLTGVPDAVFCHGKRFLAVAQSRRGAWRLAELALEGP